MTSKNKGEKEEREEPIEIKNSWEWAKPMKRSLSLNTLLVRHLSGNWTCRTYVFLWTFIFLCFFAISLYVSLTSLFSIILFRYLLTTRDTQDEGEARFDFTNTGNSLNIILRLRNLSRFPNWPLDPMVDLYQSLHSNSASTTSISPSISTTGASSILSTPTAPKKASPSSSERPILCQGHSTLSSQHVLRAPG